MAKKRRFSIDSLELTDIAAGGNAVGRHEGKVVFVEGGLPGETVGVFVSKNKKDWAQGNVTEIIKPSKDRIEAVCDHYDACGGCKLQHAKYSAQLEYKSKIALSALDKIGKVTGYEVLPILGSKKEYAYRNKLEYTFSSKRWLTEKEIKESDEIEHRSGLGYHVRGAFDKVIDIHNCHLMEGSHNRIRNELRDFARENDVSFYDIREHQGLLRNLVIRQMRTGQLMVILVFGENQMEKVNLTMEFLKEKFPEITSLYYCINTKLNDSLADQTPVLFDGESIIYEKIGALEFRVGPLSFFQTNSYQVEELYNAALDFAHPKPGETIYDLYCGTGTIGLFAASKGAKVVGIETIPSAIDDAKLNAEHNSITNATFLAGNVEDLMDQNFVNKYGKPDIVFTDPPRSGMHKKVVDALNEVLPNKIVYISCNPATQARDIEMLSDKYKVVKFMPVDMFPQTFHIESVALLEKH